MFNTRSYYNSRPEGFGVLELAGDEAQSEARRFAPLKRTDLSGEIVGPLATLRLMQTFAIEGSAQTPPIEALYRFPLPGDAAVTGVRVRFGEVEIQTALRERTEAEAEYADAKRQGRQAALVTRESPDVFTLAVAGIRNGQSIQVETSYVQLARAERSGWSLRVPLTTAPRYVRADEAGSRHSQGQPLALLRDPGHRFSLDLTTADAAQVNSPTHALSIENEHARLRDGDVIPDRDFVLRWQPAAAAKHPSLSVWVDPNTAAGFANFLALAVPPAKGSHLGCQREVVLLIDHSGSMEGAKWEAADWAVERFLAGLSERDSFALGVFHNTPRWHARQPRPASRDEVRNAVEFLRKSRDSGGTELGVALEQALELPRTDGVLSRHVLVITDAEVSDAGRLLHLVDHESSRADRRRVSVLCIDAAPNAALATDLAERGGGVSRFLTSDPVEDDVATALDEVLADWAAPDHIGLALEINRSSVEAIGKGASVRVPGPATGIDLGDPPAGRPVWTAGRVPLKGEPLTFRLTVGESVLAQTEAGAAREMPGLKALFGADRIRRLEHLMHSDLATSELETELERLGIEASARANGGKTKVYAENERKTAETLLKPILVRESLAAGLPSSETAFIAVRKENGQPVGETVVVANALPAGWSESFSGLAAGSVDCMLSASFGSVRAAAAPRSGSAKFKKLLGGAASAPLRAMAQSMPMDALADQDDSAAEITLPRGREVRIVISAGSHVPGADAVLYSTDRDKGLHPLPATGRLTSLKIVLTDGIASTGVDHNLALLLFVGDMSSPRARVGLSDLFHGGRRPLNIRRDVSQSVRIVLADPNNTWNTGVPAMEIVLERGN